jgi:predicted unusual protein kinase regulating ubiquinone biosynthesis (AarF/ABC1/UbiB family)
VIEKAFGQPIEEIFEWFEKDPIASGAIAQVHRAKLRDVEQEVAVKVRHPGVEETIKRDLKLLLFFARVVRRRKQSFSTNISDYLT